MGDTAPREVYVCVVRGTRRSFRGDRGAFAAGWRRRPDGWVCPAALWDIEEVTRPPEVRGSGVPSPEFAAAQRVRAVLDDFNLCADAAQSPGGASPGREVVLALVQEGAPDDPWVAVHTRIPWGDFARDVSSLL